VSHALRWGSRLGLAALPLLLGLVAVEFALRVRAAPTAQAPAPLELADGTRQEWLTVPDPRLMYRAAPDVEFLGYYRTNSQGWRGPAPRDDLPADAFRVACLGDSSTMGLGVREEQAWPFQLQAMLARALPDGPTFEVLDLGTTGYSSWQNRVQLEHDVPPLDVDLVVVMPTGVNDASPTTGATDGEALGGVARGSWWQRLRLAHALGLGPPDLAGSARERVRYVEFAANIEAMVELAEAQDVPLMFVAAATSEAGRARGPSYESATSAVAEIAARHDTPLADVRADFADAEPVAFFVDPVHPDGAGHGLIAARVLETCVRR
jgi:lysophospholipase L1-like esterase